jgi:hypothetical protein
MAATIDATVSGTDSNSYVTEAESNSYFETFHWFASTWAGFSSEIKAQRLIEAARALDSGYDFTGEKTDVDQALEFPRTTQEDTAEIPAKVKRAQMEMTLLHWRERDSTTGQREPGLKAFEAAGKVKVEFETGGRAPKDKSGLLGGSEDRIRRLLKEWLVGGDASIGNNNFAIIR